VVLQYSLYIYSEYSCTSLQLVRGLRSQAGGAACFKCSVCICTPFVDLEGIINLRSKSRQCAVQTFGIVARSITPMPE
jgi:hypothetical protein